MTYQAFKRASHTNKELHVKHAAKPLQLFFRKYGTWFGLTLDKKKKKMQFFIINILLHIISHMNTLEHLTSYQRFPLLQAHEEYDSYKYRLTQMY